MRVLTDHLHELGGKVVLVRCNYDVPIEDGVVQDTTRIEDSLETIRALLDHGCKVVLLAHQGRPGGEVKEEFSLKPVRELLEEKYLGETVFLQSELNADEVRNSPTRIVLMENLRFWPGEENNDPEFAKSLASMGDFYVNEAFANCHRPHASIVGITEHLPSAAGLHLAREITVLSQVRREPEHPLVVIIGGAKVETKEPLVEAFKDAADTILVGGKIAQELKDDHKQLEKSLVAELIPDGKDITEESARQFADIIMQAKTVIWNGTMGMVEEESYKKGTQIVAKAVTETPAFTVVGGGDTEAALTELNLEHGIDHISTGGGAMLDFLSDGTLVGIEALGFTKS